MNEPPPLPELAQITGRSPVKNPFPASSAFPPASAFTLIELLTVVAIIGILAAITLATLSGVRKASYRAKCISNMRAVGIGMLAYVNDYRGYFPGPFSTMQHSAGYKSNSSGTGFATDHYIGSALGSYLDLKPPKPGNTTLIADVLLCPAWESIVRIKTATPNPDYDSRCWHLKGAVFGQKNNKDNPLPRNISEFENPSSRVAIREMDSVNAAGYNCPPPVHGSTRNVLYADGHVGKESSKIQ
ncbi:prepilin-type N-terminal cleavage/methylation domain-containing protein [Opitutaceae bacterium TAV4]|nr:prepilin-type N-terminal cleavage/methylation domain-containing protein [Opitutaceae bacterium TAV4]RRK00133.1 prepilin-type N-terminal cleavage/methylation domain-containing protein [Opitutaceae bacterium TAV3]